MTLNPWLGRGPRVRRGQEERPREPHQEGFQSLCSQPPHPRPREARSRQQAPAPVEQHETQKSERKVEKLSQTNQDEARNQGRPPEGCNQDSEPEIGQVLIKEQIAEVQLEELWGILLSPAPRFLPGQLEAPEQRGRQVTRKARGSGCRHHPPRSKHRAAWTPRVPVGSGCRRNSCPRGRSGPHEPRRQLVP